MVESIALGGLAVAVSVGVIFVASRFRTAMKGNENLKNVSADIETVMGRVSHAVAMNAILCGGPVGGSPAVRTEPQCRWTSNPGLKPEDFGFEGVPASPQKIFSFRAKACLPRQGTAVTANDCKPSLAEVELELVDTQPLRLGGLLGGSLAGGDRDPWGIKMTVKTEAQVGERKVASNPSNQAQTGKLARTGTAIVRRPRMFVSFEVEGGLCMRQCTLAQTLGSAPGCIGPVELPAATGSLAASTVNVKMFNEGPGHLHHFTVKRTFIPNPEFAPGAPPFTDIVYRSENDLKGGLAAEQSISFVDTGTPCYIETMFNTVEDASRAGSSTTAMNQSRKVSGRVYYQLMTNANELDPANVLYMASGEGSIQAQERVVTTFTPPPPPPPTPPFDPGCGGGCTYGCGGDGGGGCGDGGGGCGAGGADGSGGGY
jgi:hypothetical protein